MSMEYSPSQLNAMNYVVEQEGGQYYIKKVVQETTTVTNEDGTTTQQTVENKEIVKTITEADYNEYTTAISKWEEEGRPFNTEMEIGMLSWKLNEDDPDIENKIKNYFSSLESNSSYYSRISQGLKVTDLRSVFGVPHQFLPVTDPRIDRDDDMNGDPGCVDDYGRVFMDKIIGYLPLLLITPGTPSFMANFNDKQKTLVAKLLGGNDDDNESVIKAVFGEFGGKYYSLKFAYTDYYKYVNAMLRSAATFLGIDNFKLDGTALGTYSWYRDSSVSDAGVFSSEGALKFLGPYAGSLAFYADAGTSVDDSFSNSTNQSSLFSSINDLTSKAQEINFLAGTASSLAGIDIQGLLGTSPEELTNRIDSIKSAVGGNNIFSHILGKAQTLLAGGKMIFPEIWSDSNFSRSYSAKLKLVSPSGDKLSIYLNILVPIYHLIALVLPRQAEAQSYFSPFLVRAYYQSLFNVDMGIITGMSITKGSEGEWTRDGLPTVAEVSFEIKDLYEAMSMSSMDRSVETRIVSNIQELDYIANSCGININDQEISRTVLLYKNLFVGSMKDKVQIGIFGNIKQYFNQKVQNIFGRF